MNKVICLYDPNAYELYKEGIYPSHFLYGAVQMEEAGYKVEFIDVSKKGNTFLRFCKNVFNLKKLKPDVIFIPFFTPNESWICWAKLLRLLKCPVIGISHKTLAVRRREKPYRKLLYSQLAKLFFLSPLNLEKSLQNGVVRKERTDFLVWGADLDFYDKLSHNTTQYNTIQFLSTGKENRDFETLIKAFSQTSSKIEVFTAPHAGLTYDYLNFFAGKYENIKAHLIKNEKHTSFDLAKKVVGAYCIVVPVIQNSIGYCVGFSSIVEAMALGKPVIVTENPYHPVDVEEQNIGIKVNSVEDWIKAINYLSGNKEIAEQMGKNARKLVESEFNITACGNQIVETINKLLKH